MTDDTTNNSAENDINAKALEIIRAHQCVLDHSMRPTVLGDRLLALSDEEVLEIIPRLHEMAREGNEGAREAWSTLTDAQSFVDRLDAFRKSRLYHRAVKEESDIVTALFSRGEAARRTDGEDKSFQVYGLADLTLGERMAKARNLDKETRTKAGFDVSPRVIKNLLANPRTTESDVLKIASRRPNDAKVLETIHRNKKWISRYQVKIALARNPYTPANLSKNLLVQLMLSDLLEIRYDSALHMDVRKAALEIIRRKREQNRIT